MKNKKVYFVGDSGFSYPFTLYPLNADLPNTGAVYILTKVRNGSYSPLYIDQIDKLVSKRCNCDKWICASRQNANAICVYFEDDTAIRRDIARDLVQRHCPPCNDLSR